MPVASDISTALHLLEHIYERTKGTNVSKLQMHTNEDLQLLISFLEDPVLRSIALIQDSLVDLNIQLARHPSILPGDFDINLSGQLELSVPNTPIQSHEISVYQDLYQDGELDDQRVPVAPLLHTSSEDTTSAQATSPSAVSDILGIPPITTPTYVKEFQKVIDAAAKGRHICTVQLYKPEGTSLGFSVVGLRSTDKGDLGIFLQEIQSNGIAGCDGRLLEGDQILAIDGQPLDSNISHEQAISILQKARGTVELVVARNNQDIGRAPLSDEISETPEAVTATEETVIQHDTSDINHILYKDWTTSSSVIPFSAKNDSLLTPAPAITLPTSASEVYIVERCPSAISDTSKSDSDIMLNTEWAQVEVINLINDGSGLGFGIIGGKSTGVVVKTILPGGVADHDNRLQSGDHILQIGEVNLRGMGSEQVAAVLRQSGTHVRLVVARPVEPTSPDYQASGSHAPIVPTKILADPDELDRHLLDNAPGTYNIHHVSKDVFPNKECIFNQKLDIEKQIGTDRIVNDISNPISISTLPIINTVETTSSMVKNSSDSINSDVSPEVERFTIELKKDIYGLGITIAGYVCEKEELSGIFIKSISKGSAADISNRIQMNDRIIEVDGRSLQDCTNHEAVEILRTTGPTVHLCLERYLRGPKYEQLQQVIAASESQNQPQPSSTSATRLQTFAMNTEYFKDVEKEEECFYDYAAWKNEDSNRAW
ncbi:hypothetical protein PV327_001037 [Microctonus hyperodae]|uniref:Multiple PDZ domain protein n=1 Tax=Microctonus hyperodae TaxID=165561 RepID=A0AA39G7E2_MICHY|nr:hypothetical protein PV327_001037 [Microctonus hyperodae]